MSDKSGYRSYNYKQVGPMNFVYLDNSGGLKATTQAMKEYAYVDVSGYGQKCSGGYPLVDTGTRYREITIERKNGAITCREGNKYLVKNPWLKEIFEKAEAAKAQA